ncbi:hypothetical protein R6Q57_004814 [Mikania cordata]
MEKIRRAYHAASWYSDDPQELEEELEGWLRACGLTKSPDVKCYISVTFVNFSDISVFRTEFVTNSTSYNFIITTRNEEKSNSMVKFIELAFQEMLIRFLTQPNDARNNLYKISARILTF